MLLAVRVFAVPVLDGVKPKLMGHFAKNLYHNSAKDEQVSRRDFCENIHIGLVCSGVKSSTYFYALLKSMLLYRSNPIHFHILVSNESAVVLDVLFKSWNLPQGKGHLLTPQW